MHTAHAFTSSQFFPDGRNRQFTTVEVDTNCQLAVIWQGVGRLLPATIASNVKPASSLVSMRLSAFWMALPLLSKGIVHEAPETERQSD